MGLLRISLAISVLLSHMGLNCCLNGGTSVESFFVISGFLIQLILKEKYTPQLLGRNWRYRFYTARYFRLYPIYLLGLLASVLIAFLHLKITHTDETFITTYSQLTALVPSFQNITLWFMSVMANVFMFFQDIGGVIAIHDGQAVFTWDRKPTEIYVWTALVIHQAWSLGIELDFYILAPFILMLSNRKMLILFWLTLGIKIAATIFIENDMPYRSFPFVMFDFLAGALAYRYSNIILKALNYFSGMLHFDLAYLLMLVLIFGIPETIPPIAISLIAIIITAIIIPILFKATKKNPLDRYIGELSYPFYIFHMVAFSTLHFILNKFSISESYLRAGLTVLLTIAISAVVFNLESRYVEPWRQNLGRKEIAEKPIRN